MNAIKPAKGLLALSQQDELMDLPTTYPLSASEDEGDSDGERKHQKLLEAIGSLNGKNRWKLPERSEASLKVSEFNVSSEGSGEKLALSDLLGPVKASAPLAAVRKQLSRIKSKKTLELPLNKGEVEQIHREAAFSKTSQTLSKWDSVVQKNREAEQLVFPIQKEPSSSFAPMEHMFRDWKARTPLEQEVFNLLHKNKQPVTDPLLTPVEKASLKAMSLEEAKIRRAELQRARALQSYYEARARRMKKTKSKKYHKIVKKGKAKQALKDFVELTKVDPTAALEELEKIEKARMMERMSLKHQNSGKWAKSKAIMAKYDLEARQAMQEQLAKNKELTQRLQVASESEEEGGAEEEEALVPDTVNEVQVNADGPNPWMLRSFSRDTKEDEVQEDSEQLPEPAAHEFAESEENEKPVAEEDVLLKEFEERRYLRKQSELKQDAEPVGGQETKVSTSQEVLSELRALSKKLKKENHLSKEQKESSAKSVPLVQEEEPAPEEEEPLLLQRPKKVQTVEELEALGEEDCLPNKEFPRPTVEGEQMRKNPQSQPKGKSKKEQMISLQQLLTTRTPSATSLAVPTTVEALDDEVERDQKQMIKEAFAGDDVIKEFLKEKREAIQASKPKDIDLTLPGWGEWGGMDLKPSAKKRRRFLIKAPEGPPRKDKNLPHVIISEQRNIHAAAHQVRVLPYPFTHHQQFERTIQTPMGSTWNTQRAFQKLTAPKIVTKPGHIIKPIKAEDVGYQSSPRSDLSVMQSNPRQHSKHQKQLKKNSRD
ncbi:U3 small nucleolar RNA-associated protein 14 homolog A [Meriones unguiculatus]|uniref:U3 small nucleolar RNA-associated protein 14 homolog A n=1 Tax=Meriones unguiculatus TaxID=10047 RepID=UPI000B4F3AAD|nr:U3 small nucleolar RNA-associated protein 14 homolog A [Meriones unguiculatus]